MAITSTIKQFKKTDSNDLVDSLGANSIKITLKLYTI
jgi:hypothetical protein